VTELLLEPALLGDVDDRACHTHRRESAVADQARLGQHGANGAVGLRR